MCSAMFPTNGTSITPMNSSLKPHAAAVGSSAPTRISLITTIATVDATRMPMATGRRIVGGP